MKKTSVIFFSLALTISNISANTTNNLTQNDFNKIVKEINRIHSYGLEPINNAEKDQIRKITGKNVIFLGKKKGPKKNLVEYLMIYRNGPLVLYKNTKDNYYIAGYIFDKKGKNLTASEAQKSFEKVKTQQYKEFFNQIKEKAPDFVIKIKGEGKGTAIIYTDPQCPFCKRFEKNLKGLEYLKKHFKTIYIVEYPLSFHKEAKERSFWIINNVKKAKTEEEKIKIIKEGSFKKYSEIVKENRKNKADYSQQLNKLREIKTPIYFGTPSITDEEGKDIRQDVTRGAIVNMIDKGLKKIKNKEEKK